MHYLEEPQPKRKKAMVKKKIQIQWSLTTSDCYRGGQQHSLLTCTVIGGDSNTLSWRALGVHSNTLSWYALLQTGGGDCNALSCYRERQ